MTELWVLMLQDVSFQLAQNNMRNHIMTNKFPPTIAEISAVEVEPEIDKETYARDRDIAHQQWVLNGGDPEEFVYARELPKLRS